MIAIELNPRDLASIEAELVARPSQAERALARAINKTLNWARTQGLRAIAAEHRVPLAVLRRRRRTAVLKATRRALSGTLWFGTAPIRAAYLGTPRQTRAGARVAGRLFEGAFVTRLPSGHVGVFRRVAKSRLPIIEQTVALSAARRALEPVETQIVERLQTVFAQELNYETTVKGKG